MSRAPTGRPVKAQGNALGRVSNLVLSPERASSHAAALSPSGGADRAEPRPALRAGITSRAPRRRAFAVHPLRLPTHRGAWVSARSRPEAGLFSSTPAGALVSSGTAEAPVVVALVWSLVWAPVWAPVGLVPVARCTAAVAHLLVASFRFEPAAHHPVRLLCRPAPVAQDYNPTSAGASGARRNGSARQAAASACQVMP